MRFSLYFGVQDVQKLDNPERFPLMFSVDIRPLCQWGKGFPLPAGRGKINAPHSGGWIMTKLALLDSRLLLVVTLGLAIAPGIFSAQTAQAQTYTVLHTFTGSPDGGLPGPVTLDTAGNIFGGAVSGGGRSGCGTIWKIDSSGAFTVLYTFLPGTGCGPRAPLVEDGKNNLYGTTVSGGRSSCGVVFRISPDGTDTTLFQFSWVKGMCGADSSNPQPGRLVLDRHAGILFGTTYTGEVGKGHCQLGNGACGTVWQLPPDHRMGFLYRFKGSPDGANPEGIVRNVAGNLYGATYVGGIVGHSPCDIGCGTVFKITRAGKKSTLYRFQGGSDGALPAPGELALDASGNIYGTTGNGGGNGCDGGCGTVFKISPNGQETLLYSFQGGVDAMPNGGVVLDGQGGLYGTTPDEVFHLDANGKETVLHTFTCQSDGCNANGDLAMDATGTLYGTTRDGGDLSCGPPTGCGVVFKLVP
jgi:uncharacterized repeat protein (TIGR03803 family)